MVKLGNAMMTSSFSGFAAAGVARIVNPDTGASRRNRGPRSRVRDWPV